jgi:hypothetical protein
MIRGLVPARHEFASHGYDHARADAQESGEFGQMAMVAANSA